MATELTGFEAWKAERKYGVTSNGVIVAEGLRVVDYDRKHGTVTKLGTTNLGTEERPSYWHEVTRDDGSRGTFDGSRLITESAYRKGM